MNATATTTTATMKSTMTMAIIITTIFDDGDDDKGVGYDDNDQLLGPWILTGLIVNHLQWTFPCNFFETELRLYTHNDAAARTAVKRKGDKFLCCFCHLFGCCFRCSVTKKETQLIRWTASGVIPDPARRFFFLSCIHSFFL